VSIYSNLPAPRSTAQGGRIVGVVINAVLTSLCRKPRKLSIIRPDPFRHQCRGFRIRNSTNAYLSHTGRAKAGSHDGSSSQSSRNWARREAVLLTFWEVSLTTELCRCCRLRQTSRSPQRCRGGERPFQESVETFLRDHRGRFQRRTRLLCGAV
jgi:hypothetical protein